MKFEFFSIPAISPAQGQQELNKFCASHRIASIEKQFVDDGDRSYWAICVSYLDSEKKMAVPGKNKIDYREVLEEREFAVFARLRSLRKTLAEQEGVPAYARYMDDIIWWCPDRQTAKTTLKAVKEWVSHNRLLNLKENWQINRSSRGVTCCGYRILPGTMRLSRRRCRRYTMIRSRWEKAYLEGLIDERQLQSAYASIYAGTVHADSREWRKGQLCKYPSIEV